MRPSTELANPFANPPEQLNTSDAQFIGDLLGPEAEETFRRLGGSELIKPEAPQETLGDFVLTAAEKEELESHLPTGFWNKLDTVAQIWADTESKEHDTMLQDEEVWEGLELTPAQLQIFCDKFLDFQERYNQFDFQHQLFMHVLNRSIVSLPEKERDLVHLKIGENDRAPFLGWQWQSGMLEVTAPTGHYFAHQMRGGVVIARQVGPDAGSAMSGGLLIIEEAQNTVGFRMTGGLVRVEKAADSCGEQLRGGKIEVAVAGNRLGCKMEKGSIIANQVGDYCGKQMSGGAIKVESAGNFLGEDMRDGTIIAADVGEEVGIQTYHQPEPKGVIYITHSAQSYASQRINSRIIRPNGVEVKPGETK